MADDVVAELDRWLDNSNDRTTPIDRRAVLRARDEIVALRERLHDQNAISVTLENAHAATRHARDGALEEAVQACTDQTSDDPPPGTYNDACEDCAAAIRALKDKRHD